MTNSYMHPEITPELRDSMNRVGRLLGQTFEGRGFALFVFDYWPDGTMNYLSNADRADMLVALREFIAVNEDRAHEPPEGKQ
jgi:hypothetical protein